MPLAVNCLPSTLAAQLPLASRPMMTWIDRANFAAASSDVLAAETSSATISMSPAVLGTAAGAAAVTVGRGVAAALGNGLSFAAELAKVAGSPLSAAVPSAKTSGGLRTALTQRISELTERIRRQLATAGIKLARPVELISDGLGGIVVAGSHPQQGAIERTIDSDVLLERDFAHLAADYREFVAQHGTDNLPAAFTISLAETSNELTTRK